MSRDSGNLASLCCPEAHITAVPTAGAGQHLRALPVETLTAMVGERWVASGLLKRPDSPFVANAVQLLQV